MKRTAKKKTASTRKKKLKTANSKQVRTKKAPGNIVLSLLAVGAAGVLGYLGWQYYKKMKGEPMHVLLPDNNPRNIPDMKPVPSAPPYIPSSPDSEIVISKTKSTAIPKSAPYDFPLKKGSKSEKVRSLQQALISKHGKQVLPRYGADGQFGTEVVTALKKLGHPATVSETLYNVIVQQTNVDMSSIGRQLFDAAQKKDLATVLNLLKGIGNKDQYKLASTAFQERRLNGGVRQTLVNGLMNTFAQETQKQKIRYEFIRMGLLYDGKKWSLEGLDGPVIITKEPATVWANATQKMQVPAKTVLGTEVTKRLDYIVFENNKKFFLVQSRFVKYL